MPRLFIVHEAFQSFPDNDIGGSGDIAVNDVSGEVRKKNSTEWTNLVASNLEGSGSPVDSVTPNYTGQYYKDTDGPTYYISTGTTSTDWEQLGGSVDYLVYQALLTQSGTSAPVATVLENTMGGDPVWSYDSTGFFLLTLAGAFPDGKVFILFSTQTNAFLSGGSDTPPNTVYINTANAAGAQTNGLLFGASLEIRVYP